MRTTVEPVILIVFIALLPALTSTFSLSFNVLGLALLSGWLGTGIIAASLLLMIREPVWATWFGGLQRMYQWHHGMGVTGFVLFLMHLILLAKHYFPLGSDVAWEFLSPANLYSTNILGWAALIIFALGLSINFVPQLPYRWWRRFHMLLVVAMALGLGHVWSVSGFSISLMMALLPAIVAVGWRFLRTDQGIGAQPYEVSAVNHPTDYITEAMLQPLARPIRIAPSQFVSAAFFEGPHFRGCGDFHPYTVSQVAKEGSLTLSIKALGNCTRHIQALEPGVAVRLQGPYGSFLLDRPIAPEVWIAAGIGLTPFLALLRDQPVTRHTDLVYIHREGEKVPYEKELQISANSQESLHFNSIAMTNDPAPLFAWLECIEKLNEKQVYLCGPPPLMTKTIKWLQAHGVPKKQIHFEQFDFR